MTPPPLWVSPKAEEEARKAARRYERESSGLGVAFLEVIGTTLGLITERPLLFPVVYRDIRRALMKRFPYGIFYRLRPDRIRVIAIVHLARHPRVWQRRQ
jgi:plasmid stabilization system protein ParE